MIIHNCVQHGEEWDRLRRGIPTSSEFAKIITPVKGKPSDQWRDYAYRKIAERILDITIAGPVTDPMERGQTVEEEAVLWYEIDQSRATGRDITTEKVGFITDDDRTMGCSPDRLVGDDGLLEVKSPLANRQVQYLITGQAPVKFRPQLQGQLLITDRKWVDIMCWHDRLPKRVVRVWPENHFIVELRAALRKFNEFVATEMEKIVTSGYVHVPEAKATLRQQLLDTLAADQWP